MRLSGIVLLMAAWHAGGFAQGPSKAPANAYSQAVAFNNIGKELYTKNQYDSAFFYQFKAMQLSEDLHNDSLTAESAKAIGLLYNKRKDYWKSFLFHEKAAALANRRGKKDALYISCLSNKAIAYSWLKKYKEALLIEEELLPVAERYGDYNYLSTIKMNKASNHVSLGDYANARIQLDELAANLPSYPVTPFYRAHNMAIIGIIYWDMKENARAKKLLIQQILPARALKENGLLERIYDTLSVIEESEGHYKQALTYKKEAQGYKAVIDKESNDKLFSEMEVKYKAAEKEKELTEKQLQLYYTVTALIVFLLITVLLFILYRHKRAVHARELNAVQQQKDIHLLQALMQGEEKERTRIARDLHDGVAGMLAAVQLHLTSIPAADDLLRKEEGYRKGMKLLNEAAQEIRKTSHNLMPEVLLQHGLDEALRRYCGSVNNNRSLKIIYDSWGEIDRFVDSFELSVYRIVQELINNILKHSKATQANVQLTQHGGLLTISIEDNGVGFTNESLANGIGLRSLQNRVTAMNGKIEMQVSEPNGVCAYLEFEISEINKMEV